MPDLLHSQDHPGFPPRAYGPTPADFAQARPALTQPIRADVCVIGAGFTGLSAALHLARTGRDVCVLEANRIGYGASGRNGGQLLSGQRRDQADLQAMVGRDDARRLWDLSRDALALVRSLVAEGGIECDLQSGAIAALRHPREMRAASAELERHAAQYGASGARLLDTAAIEEHIASRSFVGGVYDPHSGHLNPLAFVRGLARMAEAAGARLCEASRVTQIAPGRVTTGQGAVNADHIVLACNGYLGDLAPAVAARVMPINNFIAVTEPLQAGAALKTRHCVFDTKHVVSYFRTDAENRLIFGGGESYGYRYPRDIAAKVRRPLARIFPHLRDVRFQDAWGGTLAITMTRMPHFARLGAGLWSASGYSGHGVGSATQAGQMIAQAIAGDDAGFALMERVPTPRFPGGTRLRWPLLVSAMLWYGLRDRLGI